MPTIPSTLQKSLYLKKIFTDSITQDHLESSAAFYQKFNTLIDKIKAVENQTLTKISFAEIKYNRGNNSRHTRRSMHSLFHNQHMNPQELNSILEDQVSRLCKTFLEDTESKGISAALRQSLQEKALHSILYHNARTTFDITYTKRGQRILQNTRIKLALSAIYAIFFAIVSFLGPISLLPLATALFAATMAYISGLLYGILNDIFATRSNLAYFILGHQPGQRSFMRSNDLLVQAIAWGVIATEDIAEIAAVVFGVSVLITASLSSAPLATFVLPLLAVSLPFAVFAAHLFANHQTHKYLQNGYPLDWLPNSVQDRVRTACGVSPDAHTIPLDKIDFDSPELRALLISFGVMDEYQLNGHALMTSSPREKATWLANSDRNLAGYIGAPLLAVGGLIALLSVSKTTVSPILFSTLFSTTIPLIVASIIILFLAITLTYALNNKNKQIDNKYKLNTHDISNYYVPDVLYFDKTQAQAAMALTETDRGLDSDRQTRQITA